MANIRDAAETAEIYKRVLTAATELFMEKGYERTTVQDIAKLSGIPKTKIFYEMKSKEDILCALVSKFLDGVTAASDAQSKKLTDDKILIYIANEVLQIYMAEMNEDMRNLYLAGYSLQKTSEAVLIRRTDIMYEVFSEMFPKFEKKDFYETEIASMGIMRAYMTIPCDMYFTIEAKANRLVTMLLRIYKADDKKINEAIEFTRKIDFETVAKKAVEDVFSELAIKMKNKFPKGAKQ
ncbi:MAG: TetR/AcrR family transcriptional regulator [Clostridia bacterium]|nr:TetR/AcrR family transcriptional regulator [Clostridia bacterium]